MLPSLGLLRSFYFVSLGALGAVMPFLGARLEAAGLSGHQIGLLMAMLPLGRLVSAPLWGWLADRFAMAGLLLRIGCTLAVVGGLALLYGDGPAWAGLGLFLFSAGRVPLGPLVDTFTLQALSRPGHDPREYGRVRLWGSVGFLGLAIVCGRMADVGLDPLGLGVVLLVAITALAFRFPSRGAGGPAPVLPALRVLLQQPFLVPLLAMACLQALTLSVYDTFFSAHVHALGLSSTVTAVAIALGVACEVAVMRYGRPILARLGAPRALLLAALAGVPRWALTAWVADPAALVAVQLLHGVGFGVFWIAGVQLMAEKAPPQVSASAQSLFNASSYGVGALVGALLAGEVRAVWGTAAIFEAMTLVSCGAAGFAGWLVWRERAVEALRRAA
ncbi:MAG: MFS transporter [Pseudomonadota bacterium]|nr:MFS transporter [Pseudomonadota bacterium]